MRRLITDPVRDIGNCQVARRENFAPRPSRPSSSKISRLVRRSTQNAVRMSPQAATKRLRAMLRRRAGPSWPRAAAQTASSELECSAQPDRGKGSRFRFILISTRAWLVAVDEQLYVRRLGQEMTLAPGLDERSIAGVPPFPPISRLSRAPPGLPRSLADGAGNQTGHLGG